MRVFELPIQMVSMVAKDAKSSAAATPPDDQGLQHVLRASLHMCNWSVGESVTT
jgi:hypothetical protein